MTKTAFITGIAGQDGAYLAQFLREKGYSVHGLVRWDSYSDPLDGLARLDALGLVGEDVRLHMGDVTDANNLNLLIREIRPDEIYNLAGLSQVQVSFETPASTLQINTAGTLNILDAVRVNGLENYTRVYQASSSEMFGKARAPQNEDTKMEPCSPYGVAKLASYHLVKSYRESYGMYAANGILFNHESPLRGEDFVTRKITKAVAAVEAGSNDVLRLGNLDSVRDWGDARDFVAGMWAILQRGAPDDYVLATGEAHSVREFAQAAFAHVGISLEWRGAGVDEKGVEVKSGRVLVEVDRQLFRPSEVHHLLGDAAKARDILGWAPKTTFEGLVAAMVNADRAALRLDGGASWSMAG
ncbi:MAG: GDP-mannose 4,6-dehydratase [Rhodospirillales bacterium]|nr:GDP-mannose 4,6-dehydratase [Alphaproteobacteria bacterium]MCB9981723.1 GDP-mannose 4,6-dehydratase [Rhodospirillales bacterium]